MILQLITFILSCYLPIVSSASISFDPDAFLTDSLPSPLALSRSNPVLSWRYLPSQTRGAAQSTYQLKASLSSQLNVTKSSNSNVIWDTGRIFSNASSVAWSGPELQSRQRIEWQVNAWDEAGEEVGWSAPASAHFETGLLNPTEDWTEAKWITNSRYATGNSSLPYFVEGFSLPANCSKVDNARAYVAGLGVFSASINGQSVSKEVLAPGYTTYNKTVYYSAYDVTSLLSLASGTHTNNTIGIALGKGTYDAERPLDDRYAKFIADSRPLQVIAQVVIQCQGGETMTVVSNEDWLTTVDGPLLESSWYGGEEYDARRAIPGWDTPEFDRSHGGWTSAAVTGPPSEETKLVARRHPPLEIVDEFAAISANEIGDGEYVFDFGVNFAGWYSISMTGSPNLTVTLRPSELVLPNGSITQSTTGQPIFDRYTFSSSSLENYTQSFMYHGMRYLQLSFPTNSTIVTPKAEDARAHVIRSTNEEVGIFESSNKLWNNIHKITQRAVESNMFSVMTDCPHREKLGWLEQDHLVFPAIQRYFDIEAFGRSTMANIQDSAVEDSGLVPTTSPEFVVFGGGFRDDTNWGNTAVLLPLYLYQTYGEISILSDNYPVMTHWLEYLSSKSTDFIIPDGLGDWGSADFDSSYPPPPTSKNLTATWGYARAAASLAEAAGYLGKEEDVQKYQTLADEIKAAFHETFFNKSTNDSYDSGTQASNALALSIDAVPEEFIDSVLNSLVQDIKDKGNHTDVGEVALPSLFNVLAENQLNDVVYEILNKVDFPSYGYILSLGATSLTEYWIGANSSDSQNHFMMGAVEEWFTSHLAGIKQQPNSVGYRALIINPAISVEIESVSSSYRSKQGWISSSWSKSGTTVRMIVTIPVGTVADVYVPGSDATLDGSADIESQPGVRNVSATTSNMTIVGVVSGNYSFGATL